jgi:hypothetical protein
MKLVVNGVEATAGHAVQNWGELLAQLDEQGAAHGVVVTEVAFDDVAEASFRSPGLLTRSVASVRIEVNTASPSDLLRSAIVEALGAVGPLREVAISLAGSYREHDIARGERDMPEFARNLGFLLELTGTIAVAVGVDFAVATGPTAASPVADLAQHVDALITARAAGDWISVADLLEYEVVSVFDRCAELLSRVQGDTLIASAQSHRISQ